MDLAGIASMVSALAALGAVVMSYRNSKKIQEVHIDINSRMTELLRVSGQTAHAEGVVQGRGEIMPKGE
jgi:hypothetical protein